MRVFLFTAGLLAYFWLGKWLSLAWLFMLLPLGLGGVWIPPRWLAHYLGLCCFAAGFGWGICYSQVFKPGQLLPASAVTVVEVTGRVEGLVRYQSGRVRFQFRLLKTPAGVFRPHGLFSSGPVAALNWYRFAAPAKPGLAGSAAARSGRNRVWPPKLAPGDIWRLRVRLKRPHSYANPGGIDYETYAYAHNIVATGYVMRADANRRLTMSAWSGRIDRLRGILSALLRRVAGEQHGLVRALVIGDRQGISPRQWEVLRKTGTVHLVAISGLHVSLLASLGYFVGSRLWRLSARLSLSLAAPRAGALLATGAALVYALLAGMSLPTQRALLMVVILMLAILRQGRDPGPGVLVTTFLVLVVLDPFSLLTASFWLSFAAMGILVMVMCFQRNQSRWQQLFRVQAGLVVLMAPVTLFWFDSMSWVAPLANLVAIPLFTLILVPLCLLGTLLLGLVPAAGVWCVQSASDILGLFMQLSRLLAGFSPGHAMLSVHSPLELVAVLSGLAVLLFGRLPQLRLTGTILCMPVLVSPDIPLRTGQFEMTVLDVGQGLSVVIRTRRSILVYDTGPRYPSGFNTGAAVLVPFLRYWRIRQLDRVMISHPDMDHRGGLRGLARHYRWRQLYGGEKLPGRWRRLVLCQRGEGWYADGVRFELLHPDQNRLSGRRNDRSCVLKISTGRFAVLLPGDIHREAEGQLVRRLGRKLRADILIAPHHGSKTSSSEAFIQHVRPRYVVYSAGYLNRFGFPHVEVVRRYRRLKIRSFNTAMDGAVTIRIDPQQGAGEVNLWRRRWRPYWK